MQLWAHNGRVKPRVLQLDDRGKGDALVLVPGGLTGWLSWAPHQERLQDRYRTIRVQPIHNELGAAGIPGDPAYSAEVERESLRLTLDALGLERPHFAGWSAGGLALIEFAMQHPERVRSLALVEPAAYWVLDRLGESLGKADEADRFVESLAGREVSEDDLATFLRLGGLARPDIDPRTHPSWERWAAHRTTLSWLGPLLGRPRRSLDDLGRIVAPSLLTKGRDSTAVDRRTVDILHERLPRARLQEFPGDHAHHIEHIDPFLEALERHLSAS